MSLERMDLLLDISVRTYVDYSSKYLFYVTHIIVINREILYTYKKIYKNIVCIKKNIFFLIM